MLCKQMMRLVVTVVALLLRATLVVIALLWRWATLNPATLVVVVALLLRWAAITSIALVTGIAESVATHGSEGTADGSTLKAPMTLGADDAADPCTSQGTNHRTSLRIRT